MGDEKDRNGLLFVLLVYAASRLFYLGAGALFASVVPVARFQRITADVPFGTMNLWSHWDGEHYVALAAGGYLQPPDNVSPAFFPLYPLLIRSFAELFGGPLSPPALSVWGVLLSLLALPFAFYFVYNIAREGFGERAARATVLTLALFPTSFFFNAVYTESLFLALSAGSIWALQVRRDLLLACCLRVCHGHAQRRRLPPCASRLRVAERRGGQRVWWGKGVACLALAPSGLLAYAAYLWSRSGDLFLFYSEQGHWSRRPTGPSELPYRRLHGACESLEGLFRPQPLADSALGRPDAAASRHDDAYNLLSCSSRRPAGRGGAGAAPFP